MNSQEAVARVLKDLPSGWVRRASAPRETLPCRTTGMPALDGLLGGGWPRGRMAVLRAGAPGAAGRTTMAMAAVAATTAQGRTAAWIDGDASLDPASLAAAGADLSRVLWVRGPLSLDATLSAAEEVLGAGDFAVTVVRPPDRSTRTGSAWPAAGSNGAAAGWIRLARGAERGRTVLLVLDRGGTAAAAGGVVVHLGTLRGRWAGMPGPGCLLVGAEVAVEADEGSTNLCLSVADALERGDWATVSPRPHSNAHLAANSQPHSSAHLAASSRPRPNTYQAVTSKTHSSANSVGASQAHHDQSPGSLKDSA